MIRTCPKCGDYYADALLAFCLFDGTPLMSVDPLSEKWSEGARVIEEKENALRKQKRRLKWRRVFVSAATMLIAVMVVLVVAANGLIYLKPQPDEVALANPSTPSSEPARPVGSILPNTPGDSAPTPGTTTTPTATPKPSATPKRNNVNTNTKDPTNVNTHINTNSNPNSNTHININTDTNPNTNVNTNSSPNTNVNPNNNTNPHSDTSPALCSDADKSRERESIIRRFGDTWRRKIEGERRKIIAENVPAGVGNAEASLGAIEYASTFFKGCLAGVVTVRYVWQIRINVNETIKALTVAKGKKFACVKIGGAWLCS